MKSRGRYVTKKRCEGCEHSQGSEACQTCESGGVSLIEVLLPPNTLMMGCEFCKVPYGSRKCRMCPVKAGNKAG